MWYTCYTYQYNVRVVTYFSSRFKSSVRRAIYQHTHSIDHLSTEYRLMISVRNRWILRFRMLPMHALQLATWNERIVRIPVCDLVQRAACGCFQWLIDEFNVGCPCCIHFFLTVFGSCFRVSADRLHSNFPTPSLLFSLESMKWYSWDAIIVCTANDNSIFTH